MNIDYIKYCILLTKTVFCKYSSQREVSKKFFEVTVMERKIFVGVMMMWVNLYNTQKSKRKTENFLCTLNYFMIALALRIQYSFCRLSWK